MISGRSSIGNTHEGSKVSSLFSVVGLALGFRFPTRLVSWVLVWGFGGPVPRVFQEHFRVSRRV